MKKLLLSTALLFLFYQLVACTTFLVHKDGKLAFGRNYDWITDVGMVCTNLRGLAKTSLPWTEKTTISWVSKYGSLTCNQYGKEFPTGGMNEKGLVVEMMWMEGARYPSPDQRAALNVLQWIQYQLDNCATTEEVIATDAMVRLTPVGNPPVHYLVADAAGNAATIEFLNGKMVVHRGRDLPLPVLTNTDYATSSKIRRDSAANKAAGFNDNSIQRFATACSMIEEYYANDSKQPLIDFSFGVLYNTSNEDFTKWSIVYDISGKRVYFTSRTSPRLKWIEYSDVDFECGTASLNMDMNQLINGNVFSYLIPFTNKSNAEILQRAAAASKDRIPITEADIRRDVEYAGAIKCKS